MIDWIDTETFRAWLPELKAALRILIILVVAWVAQMVVRRVVRRIRIHFAARANGEEAKRIETLGRVVRYTLTVLILLVAGMLVLNEVGVSIAPILGAAGVVGVAVGFGAQSLIKDYFTGFFLLIENQIRVGDVVEIAGKSGLVVEITLRRVKLRGYDGSVHYVSNGLITTVTNMSTEYANAVIDVGVAYKANIDAAFEMIREVGQGMRTDPKFAPRILDDIELAGVESLADSAVVIRCRIKVLPLEQWSVRREFNKRVKEALERADIEIPFPQRTIYFGNALPTGAASPSAAGPGKS